MLTFPTVRPLRINNIRVFLTEATAIVEDQDQISDQVVALACLDTSAKLL